MKIHLIHAPLDMHRFHRWAGNRGLIRNGSFDAGYAFHVLLSAMFGKNMLQPFRLFASERRASAALYAYADVDEAELRGTADAVAPPDCLDVINPNKMRSKHMPSHFEKGRRLAARGESPLAFDEREILAACVAPPSNTGGILSRRALPARRLARLGATPDFHHGLLGFDLRLRPVRRLHRGLAGIVKLTKS